MKREKRNPPGGLLYVPRRLVGNYPPFFDLLTQCVRVALLLLLRVRESTEKNNYYNIKEAIIIGNIVVCASWKSSVEISDDEGARLQSASFWKLHSDQVMVF